MTGDPFRVSCAPDAPASPPCPPHDEPLAPFARGLESPLPHWYLRRDDDDFPPRLFGRSFPEVVAGVGRFDPAQRAVAIVGSRDAEPFAAFFAAELARRLAHAGLAVVSGGARGIDAAAHLGALAANGCTWVVCPSGADRIMPSAHHGLQRAVVDGGGAVLWPFPMGHDAPYGGYHARNGVIAALAEAVVVVQARAKGGAMSTVQKARALGRPLWAVAGVPGDDRFAGCQRAIAEGARLLVDPADLLASLGLPAGPPPTVAPAQTALRFTQTLGPTEAALLKCIRRSARHIDEILAESGICAGPGLAALLTLSLEAVVVEGPAGWFRRPG